MAVFPAKASVWIVLPAKSRWTPRPLPPSAPPAPSSRFRRGSKVRSSICASASTTTFALTARRSSPRRPIIRGIDSRTSRLPRTRRGGSRRRGTRPYSLTSYLRAGAVLAPPGFSTPLELRRHPEPATAGEGSLFAFLPPRTTLVALRIREPPRLPAYGLQLRRLAVITYQLTPHETQSHAGDRRTPTSRARVAGPP